MNIHVIAAEMNLRSLSETRRFLSIVPYAVLRAVQRSFLYSVFQLEMVLFHRPGIAIVRDVRPARENAKDVNKEININWFIRREK